MIEIQFVNGDGVVLYVLNIDARDQQAPRHAIPIAADVAEIVVRTAGDAK